MNPTHQSTRRTTGRRRGAGALLAVGALLLAACGAPPSSGGTGGGREATGKKQELPECPLVALAEAKGPVKVNLWYSGIVDPPKTVMNDLVAAFNKSQDKVVVTANDQGNAYAEGLRKYENASATPDQLPQMMLLEDTTLGEMIDKGQILPAQSCMDADGYDLTQLTPSSRARYTVDDVFYPGYMNVSTPILYYNKAHFQKAGLDPDNPPRTMDEVEEAARKIKAAGVAPKPLSFLANDWFLSNWMAGIGQDAVDNDNGRSEPPTKATFDTPPVRDLMVQLGRMNDEGLLNPFPVTDGKIDHYLAIVQQQSSMLIETSTASGTIAQFLGGELDGAGAGFDIDPADLEKADLVPASAEFPGIDAPGKIYAGGGAFYIMNTGSPAQQAASWEFSKFMLDSENSIKWHTEGGYLPMVKEVIDDPRVAEFQETALDGNLLQPAVEELAAADPDQAGPVIGPYKAYEEALRGAMEAVLFNGEDPKAALAGAASQLDAALQSYNDD